MASTTKEKCTTQNAGKKMNQLIKIYGERNTNTNYLSKLIRLNLETDELPGIVPPPIMRLQEILPGDELVRDIYFRLTFQRNLGWKHSCVRSIKFLNKLPLVKKNDIAFVTLTKNPYSWLLSLQRNPYHQHYNTKPDFLTFLKTPWKTVGRENTERMLSNPIELWNRKNSSYLKLSQRNGLNIKSESLFVDPASIIETIHTHFSISKHSNKFINYERSTKNPNKDSNYYRDYYLTEKWRENLSSEAITIINKTVNTELMTHFGYELLS